VFALTFHAEDSYCKQLELEQLELEQARHACIQA